MLIKIIDVVNKEMIEQTYQVSSEYRAQSRMMFSQILIFAAHVSINVLTPTGNHF